MTKEAKELKKEIQEIVDKEGLRFDYRPYLDKPLKVIVEIHENWFNKDKTIKRKDVANREKFLIDSIFDALEINDKNIFENTFIKIQDEEEFAEISISLLN